MKNSMEDSHFVLEGGVLIPVTCNLPHKLTSSNFQQVYVVRKGGFYINEEDIITVKEKEKGIPENHAKIIISADTEITGFTFYVNVTHTTGMTLRQQSEYVKRRAQVELAQTLHNAGLNNLIKLVTEIKDLHLHEMLEPGTHFYACDHRH
jgi:hypothetical protein